GGAADPQDVPEEYRGRLGRITEEKTIPQIKRFVESGGAVVTVGSSTGMAELLGVPLANALTEKGPEGQERPLPRDKFYIPGSLMKAQIDNSNPLAYGMPETVDVFFDNNPVFRLPADAKANGATSVAWFSGKETLDSGWALGQQLLDGATAVVEARKGEGRVFVLGPEVTFRGEPDGTFKLLFNGLFYGAAKPATLR
ncbi:MAG: peptidase, partial [Bryobacteraceae bacterium]